MRVWLARLRVVLLAALVLSGGSGLPLLDAVLYHGRAAQRESAVRLEAAGTAASHAEVCTLGRAAPVPQPSPRGDEALRVVAQSLRTAPPMGPAGPRAVDLPAAWHSRAPPTQPV
jgi:hypothetical protein